MPSNCKLLKYAQCFGFYNTSDATSEVLFRPSPESELPEAHRDSEVEAKPQCPITISVPPYIGPSNSVMSTFGQAIEVKKVSSHVYSAFLDSRWCVGSGKAPFLERERVDH